MPTSKLKKRARAIPKPEATKSQHASWNVQAFLHSVGVLLYITFVAFLMSNGNSLFGNIDNTIIGPVAMLMLFTLSAAVVGSLVFGRPVMLYLDGKKREAMNFAGATVGFLFIEALVIFIILALVNG